jgi:hypothetical protein
VSVSPKTSAAGWRRIARYAGLHASRELCSPEAGSGGVGGLDMSLMTAEQQPLRHSNVAALLRLDADWQPNFRCDDHETRPDTLTEMAIRYDGELCGSLHPVFQGSESGP